MTQCPYCESIVEEQHNFCAVCTKQVNCLKCGGALKANVPMCLICGNQIVKSISDTPSNEYLLEERQTETEYYRRIEARFTDAAADIGLSIIRGSNPLTQSSPVLKVSNQPSRDTVHKEITASGDELTSTPYEVPQTVMKSQQEQVNSIISDLYQINEGNNITFRISDFKGRSKSEQQTRFMLLYIHAVNKSLNRGVDWEEIKEAAQRHSIYDSNITKYFKDIRSVLHKVDDLWHLSPSGITQVNTIAEEIREGTLEGYSYWKIASPRRKLNATSKTAIKAKEWASIPTELDSFDIRTLQSHVDRALFSVWMLTKKLEVAPAVKASIAFDFLKEKFKTFPGDKKAFRDALGDKLTEDRVSKTSEGEYYLTSKGEAVVQAWLESTIS